MADVPDRFGTALSLVYENVAETRPCARSEYSFVLERLDAWRREWRWSTQAEANGRACEQSAWMREQQCRARSIRCFIGAMGIPDWEEIGNNVRGECEKADEPDEASDDWIQYEQEDDKTGEKQG